MARWPNRLPPTWPAALGAPFAKATETLDGIQTALEIDKHLSDLETQARAHGSAAGSAFLYPITHRANRAWAKGLEKRGFVLVPRLRHS